MTEKEDQTVKTYYITDTYDNKLPIEFIYSFFPFMFGIYPYASVTKKQKQAMKEAGIKYKYFTIYEIAYMGIRKLLG